MAEKDKIESCKNPSEEIREQLKICNVCGEIRIEPVEQLTLSPKKTLWK